MASRPYMDALIASSKAPAAPRRTASAADGSEGNAGAAPGSRAPMNGHAAAVRHRLQSFYQTVVSPPPIGLYRNPAAYEAYMAGIDGRVTAILEAYGDELRALHLDLVERYGCSPFQPDDAAAVWQIGGRAGTNGGPQPSALAMRDAASPSKGSTEASPHRGGATTTLGTVLHGRSGSHDDAANSPTFSGRDVRGFARTSVERDECLYARMQSSGIVFANASGQPRHPQQVLAVRAIWGAMQPPSTEGDAAPPPGTVVQERVAN